MSEIHVINLDRSVERLEIFRRRNAHLKNVHRYPGIDGRTLNRDQLVEQNIITSDLDYTAGSLGCALSHVALWKEAVDRNEPMTVAEDDAIFSHHFESHMRSLLLNVRTDWDFILWSASLPCYAWLDALPGGTGARLQFFTGEVMTHIEEFQSAETEPALLRARHLLGLQCYSISPKGARALLDWCFPIRPMLVDFTGFGVRLNNTGIDCVTSGLMPSLKAYTCLPPLVITDDRAEDSVRVNT
ncbi:glycosyltransferase family 25 protein [Mesorhizobium carmichaelinearum]|uniref:glycosyltransferase family 25 protein n=1 Tax=Mesorhizobium carmichaelinearum TaxID=1208188 RepID=UPI00117CEC3C|nr:glycosyltransferase family 25 protein [Mesorhizobium carmichaelinearum]